MSRHNPYPWSPVSHMNKARAGKPESGGSIQRQSVTQRPESDWDVEEKREVVDTIKLTLLVDDAYERYCRAKRGETLEGLE